MPGGYTFDRLRDELALRIVAIPEFRAKLADSQLNLDHPVWVEDKEFDLDRHLTASACRRREGDGNWPRSAGTSPPCRWIAAGRCGRCG